MKDLTVISDSSPIIALVKKRELSLLKVLFNEIIIPKAVYEELTDNPEYQEDQRRHLQEEINLGWIIVRELKTLKYPDLNLGKGEIEAINACFEIDDAILLVDERKGRNIAKSLNITVLGILGVLALAKKKAFRTVQEIEDNLEILINQGFYLSSDVILGFLKKIRKI